MEITDEIFSKVVKMVESGFTIQQACKKINIDRGVFYYKISKNQKSILKQAKTSSSLMLGRLELIRCLANEIQDLKTQ